jgi:hypothetical protein
MEFMISLLWTAFFSGKVGYEVQHLQTFWSNNQFFLVENLFNSPPDMLLWGCHKWSLHTAYIHRCISFEEYHIVSPLTYCYTTNYRERHDLLSLHLSLRTTVLAAHLTIRIAKTTMVVLTKGCGMPGMRRYLCSTPSLSLFVNIIIYI